MTRTGWIPPENIELTFDKWQAIGQQLQLMVHSIMWNIGDWLNYGERIYGEIYTQALEETDYAYQTLADEKWIASRIEFSRRRENLSFSHHKEVAALDPADQDTLLDESESSVENAGKR